MTRVLVPLATGSEELEAVTIIDLLRRANITVSIAGLDAGPVTTSRGTTIVPDMVLDDALGQQYDMIVLPGGQPGASHMAEDERVRLLVKEFAAKQRYIAAICAAPKVLALAGLLDGKKATCYPGTLDQQEFPNIQLSQQAVVIDGNIVTSRGPGTAMDFALQLIELLLGKAARDQVEKGLVR